MYRIRYHVHFFPTLLCYAILAVCLFSLMGYDIISSQESLEDDDMYKESFEYKLEMRMKPKEDRFQPRYVDKPSASKKFKSERMLAEEKEDLSLVFDEEGGREDLNKPDYEDNKDDTNDNIDEEGDDGETAEEDQEDMSVIHREEERLEHLSVVHGDWASQFSQRTVDFDIQPPYKFTSYKGGPILEGWEPGVDRDLKTYVKPRKNTVILGDSCVERRYASAKDTDQNILIMVMSAPNDTSRRESSRETWLKWQREYPQVKVFFVVGTTTNATEDLLLKEEANWYCDIIQMDFVDGENNGTLGVVMSIKFILHRMPVFKSLVKNSFLMVSTDRSYIHIPNLVDKLQESDAFHEVQCFKILSPWVTRLPAEKKPPRYIFSRDKFPYYCGGGNFVIPFHMLRCMYDISQPKCSKWMKKTLHDIVMKQGGLISSECDKPYNYCHETDSEGKKTLKFCAASTDMCEPVKESYSS